VNRSQLRWYIHRLGRMSATEIAWRTEDLVRQSWWRRRWVRPGAAGGPVPALATRRLATRLRPADAPPADAVQRLVAAADDLLAGRSEILGVERDDLVDPDWFLDPTSGERFPDEAYAFAIDYRGVHQRANVKQVWELSRHHHLTLLAAAWWVTDDDRYAERVAAHLRSWWGANPFLNGVAWASGIEVGIRMISWVWVRRLLDGWSGAAPLFEDNDEALRQIRWHQEYLATFQSRGTSANNHVIAEAAGQLVASCAFDWFAESDGWREQAARLLERELGRNTFESGLNRELASEYHGLVAELGLLGAIEADASGHPLAPATEALLCRMLDGAAAIVDESGRGPRQGDGDDGRGLVLDPPSGTPWRTLLAIGAARYGAADWWPPASPGVTSTAAAALARPLEAAHTFDRPAQRPSHFADAGLTVLRTDPGATPEIWCRCDSGPHGFLSIAAHAHADALSIEVRCDGVDVLADPGTFCYQGQPEWRRYFRSTLSHNTIELDGQDQSVSGGPFLWVRHAVSRTVSVTKDGAGRIARWDAEHDGYRRLAPSATHRRTAELHHDDRRLDIVDVIDSSGEWGVKMAFHLGPAVTVDLAGGVAQLTWAAETGRRTGVLNLPPELRWSEHRGEVTPLLGWFSPRFGVKEPTTTLLGIGRSAPGRCELSTSLQL
jgi:hypothetical protein